MTRLIYAYLKQQKLFWFNSVYIYGFWNFFGPFNLINDLCAGWEIVVLRDFNSPSVKWSNVLVQRESIDLTDQLLLDCFAACSLHH